MRHLIPCWLTLAVAIINLCMLIACRSLVHDLRSHQSWWQRTFVTGDKS